VPHHIVLDRDSPDVVVEEFDDRIVIGGEELMKPFVEKPICGDDHNIFVYYPDGSCRRLFRKIRNRSSEILPRMRTRTNGVYVYEKFVPTGRDIKVFAVGQ
jgi:inositol hexakisphosphate/diphosphoinositol-pentakisphosphate kinase